MTKRQLTGFAVCMFSLLALILGYWLAPIYWFTPPKWALFVPGGIITTAWGIYYSSDFAKRK